MDESDLSAAVYLAVATSLTGISWALSGKGPLFLPDIAPPPLNESCNIGQAPVHDYFRAQSSQAVCSDLDTTTEWHS